MQILFACELTLKAGLICLGAGNMRFLIRFLIKNYTSVDPKCFDRLPRGIQGGFQEASKEVSKRPRNKLVPRLQEASRGFKEASKRLQEAPRGFKMHHIAILGLPRGLTVAIPGLHIAILMFPRGLIIVILGLHIAILGLPRNLIVATCKTLCDMSLFDDATSKTPN